MKSSIRETYGQQGDIHTELGFRASSFNEHVLQGAMDVAELMDRHSMFPLITSVVSAKTADRWREAVALGDGKTKVLCRTLYDHGFEKLPVLRQCPTCVREDVNIFGSGHWRVMHQIPVIRFCQVHGELLQDQCARCNTSFVNHFDMVLPGEPCPCCGSDAVSSSLSNATSMGYTALAKLIERALRGEAPELDPRIRTRLLQSLIAAANDDAKSLLEGFLSWWGVDSLHALNAQLQCRTDNLPALQLFMSGHARVKSPFLMAAAAFAWEHTSESDQCQLLQHKLLGADFFSSAVANTQPDEVLREELTTLAHMFSLPEDVVDLLTNGHKALAITLIGNANYVLLAEGLSPTSKSQMRHCFANPKPRTQDKRISKIQAGQSQIAGRVQTLREKVLAHISNGCQTRSSLKSADPTLYANALLMARNWLDEVLPSKHRVARVSRNADLSTRREHYRAMLLQARRSGSLTRTELRSVCCGACDFAIRYDRKWFENLVGAKSVRRRASAAKSKTLSKD